MKVMKATNNNNLSLGFKINSSQVLRATWARYRKDIKINPNSYDNYGTHLKRTWAIARENKIKLSNFSFNEFYTKNYDKLLFFVNGILKNLDIAQEITNEAFVKFNNSLSIFDSSKSSIITYLHTIAKNLSLEHFNNLKLIKNQVENNKLNISQFVDDKGKEKHEFVDHTSLDVHEILENQESLNTIDNNLNSLDEKYKIISTLYFVNHYKYREIAEILNININTVKTQIKRAKDQLQNTLINNNISIKTNINKPIFEPKKVLCINSNTNLESVQDNVLFYEVDNDNLYY
jgi:RNA polymerase sigma factor (sigma-70 family)